MGEARRPLPELLTVAEAARALGIGTRTAYARARMWEQTAGRAGLPSVRVGRSLRVVRAGLERQLGRPVSVHVRDADVDRARRAKHRADRVERNVDGQQQRHDGDRVELDTSVESADRIEAPADKPCRAVAISEINICHPFGEAASAPAAPPPAGRRARRSRGDER